MKPAAVMLLAILAGCESGQLYDPSTYLGNEIWKGNHREVPKWHCGPYVMYCEVYGSTKECRCVKRVPFQDF